MKKRTYLLRGLLIIGGVVLVSLVFLYDRLQPRGDEAVAGNASTVPAVVPDVPPTPLPNGLMEYKNSRYLFSLAYPEELKVQEYAEKGGGRTIIFETPDMKKGFQIFIVPYSGKQISKERFLMDQPSGVRKQSTDVVIDGTTATMFFGENMVMGETREVWFVKNGFLFEVTTYKGLDEWLSHIMATWKWAK